jgi:hypothetical protein
MAVRCAHSLLPCLLLVLLSACGKKGPPLAPLQLLPARIEDLAVTRAHDEVQARFTLPVANQDGTQPASLGAVELYGLSGKPLDRFGKPLGDVELFRYATLVGRVDVESPPPVDEEPPPTAKEEGTSAAPPPKPALPPDPRPAQGETVTLRETITAELMKPFVHPQMRTTRSENLHEELRPGTPLWWPEEEEQFSRVYVAVGISRKGQRGAPSARVSVPLVDPPAAPGTLTLAHDASSILVKWPSAPGARLPIQGAGGGPAAPAAPAAATPAPDGSPTAAPTPPLAPLASKPAIPSAGLTTYNVYDAKAVAAFEEAARANGTASTPAASRPSVTPRNAPAGTSASTGIRSSEIVASPPPLNAAGIDDNDFVDPRLVFGEERCYVVRAVQAFGAAKLESPSSEVACITPKDTFPPAAPKNLVAVGSEGGVSLIWEANTEADLDGYLVLRGEVGADGRAPAALAALTQEPLHDTTYRDTTAKPNVRYVYAVVAVDRTTPRNTSPESNRVEESAR